MQGLVSRDLLLDVPAPIVDRDISVFFRENFRIISASIENLAAGWPGENTVNLLVQRAEGLFIFASLVCLFLTSDKHRSPQDLLQVLLQNNSGDTRHKQGHSTSSSSKVLTLDGIYTQILRNSFKNAQQNKDENAELFRKVVGSLAILIEPLSEVALAELLGLPRQLLSQILLPINSMLNIPENGKAPIFFSHSSFRDFVLDKQRNNDETFPGDERQQHKALSECCIRLLSRKLRKDICELQVPGSLVQGVCSSLVSQKISPDVHYACLYWVRHLQKSGVQLHDNDDFHQFLKEHLLHWLEALGWLQKTSEGIASLFSLEAQIMVSIPLTYF